MPHRLVLLMQGETDVCGATLSLDPEWTDRVEFIQPYFYSAGIALYMDQVGLGWAGERPGRAVYEAGSKLPLLLVFMLRSLTPAFS